MKGSILFCFALFALKLSFAQNMDDKARFKKLSGSYNRSLDGISLFEDGTFLLYGYATAVFGKYSFEKDLLRFVPDKSPLFEVYATENSTLKDNVRINFKGFDGNHGAYLQLGTSPTARVFNADANCFDSPFVYETKKWSGDLILSNYIKNEFLNIGGYNFSLEYHLPKNSNDFILVYNAPSRYTEEFKGVVKGNILRTSEYGGETGFAKKSTEDNGRDWAEILEWKKQYDLEKVKTADFVYANKHYKVFPGLNDDYVFDNATQQFVLKNKQQSELYYLQNQYNDERYLRKYVKLKPVSEKEFNPTSVKLAAKPIFYTVCGEGSDKSYHYNGYAPIPESDQVQEPTMLQPIPNVIIDEPKIKFYFLRFSDGVNEMSLPKTTLFTQGDILESIKNENGADSFTINLKLNAKAIKNIINLNSQAKDEILVMLGTKNVKKSTFKITDNTIRLTATFTVDEIEEIFKELQK